MRNIDRTYSDPLSIVWLNLADQLRMQVRRDSEVFAAWDGDRVLTIGTDETLDPDDSLAQMIFHEVCHALTEGPEALSQPDWGLENDREDHIVREHACLRIQAALADGYGLRVFFATTTDFREYYDRLSVDPLSDDGDPATAIAAAAWDRVCHGPWSDPLREALKRTAAIKKIVQAVSPNESLWASA